MANIKISRKSFEKEIGPLTADMQTKIAMFGTTLESFDDNEIELEIFPNRPDILSYQGFKRAFLGFLGKKTGLVNYKIHKPEKNFEVVIDKNVSDVRPYTACAIVKGLKFDDKMIKEVIDIQEKLHSTLGRNRKKIAIGIYPLEKIKLPIKYEARDPNSIKFVPLEARAEMTGRQILSGHPAGRDYAYLLEGKEQFPVFVDAAGEILSMPPIINSHKTGKITSTTREIFIECSGFDFTILKKALNILVTMFADMRGQVYQMKLNYKGGKFFTPDFEPEKMKINLRNCNKLLGLELTEKEMSKCLHKMGYNYKKGEVEIPAWRVDLLHENDLIEDVAIAYGYDKFEPEIPMISTIGETDSIEVLKQKIAEVLSGLGMLELANYHLTTVDDQYKRVGIKKQALIEVQESKTEYNILRRDLLHCLLRTLCQNVDAEYPQKVFESGVVFSPDKSQETGVKENQNLAVAMIDAKTDFTEIKQVLDYLMRALDKEYKIEPAENSYFIEGRSGKIVVDGEEIGYIGEIAPNILSNLKLKMPVTAFEIDIERLL